MSWASRILLALVATAACFGWGYLWGHSRGSDTVQRAWDRARQAQIQEHDAEQLKARQREQALQDRADQIRQEKNREIADLSRRNAALADSLRNRPERPAASQTPTPASAGPDTQSCTGRELYRPDAEFLVREAARADQIRITLAACEAAYTNLLKD